MNLKVLFIPACIIAILVLIIMYIKPDFSAMQLKKQELAVKNEQVARMDAVIGNIDSLERDLNSKKDSEEFIYRYFPKVLEQSKVIDAVNFLSEQTGVALASIDLEETKAEKKEGVSELGTPGALTSLNPGLNPGGGPTDPGALAGGPGAMPGSLPGAAPGALPGGTSMLPLPSVPLPEPTKVTVKISAEGTYGNVKEFMTRVSHMDRFNEFASIDFQSKSSDSSEEGGSPANPLLTAALEVRLDFLPEEKAGSALNVPFFQQTRFDLTSVDALRRWITSPLPALEKVEGGKANPFQK